MRRLAFVIPLALTLAGCASSMSGIGGTEGYACRAPEGTQCMSVAGVYASSLHGAFAAPPPKMLVEPAAAAVPAARYGATPLAPVHAAASTLPPEAIRSTPRVLRVWIAPWEDSDGDLHEASTVHLLVDTGRWLIKRVRPATSRRSFAVTPPAVSPSEPPPSKPSGDTLPSIQTLPHAPPFAPSGGEAAADGD
jgi:conjugal transfer pilus assembly protein TraV